MYCNSFPRAVFNNSCRNSTVLQTKYSFLSKYSFSGDKFQNGVVTFYSTLLRHTSSTIAAHSNSYGSMFLRTRDTLLQRVKQGVERFPLSLREQSVHIVRVCAQQCEWVLAHRIRRGQQIFSLYSRLWDEVALKELMKRMRRQLSKRGKEFLLGAAGMSMFDWEKERIPDEEVFRSVFVFTVICYTQQFYPVA
jgi:hypothetical protein